MQARLRKRRYCRLVAASEDSPEGVRIKAGFSLPAERVIRSVNRIIEWRAKVGVIRVDNGAEYISGMLMAWPETKIIIAHIQPDLPQQNA